MRSLIAAALVLAVVSTAGHPQEQPEGDIIGVIVPRQQEEARNRLELSKSRGNYPVTPGDLYTLRYRSAGIETATEVLVESDYTVNLGVFGVVRARGLTFPELKTQVESIIARAYPNSLPFLTITSVGVFEVYVSGEVVNSRFVTAWGLSRLSEVIQASLTPYSSARAVEVVSADGQARRYDVYRALHEGGLDQDPFVRPGDGIVLLRRGSEVSVGGEVARPGKYQILQGEGLEAVVRRYGGGISSTADAERIKVTRTTRGQMHSFQIDLGSPDAATFALEDGDAITVPPLTDRLPVAVFEGAITRSGAPAGVVVTDEVDPASAEPYTRLIHRFTPGDTIYDALLSISASISPAANLARSYIVRKGSPEVIPVDLEAMYYSHNRAGDVPLQPSDRVVIPFYRYYVSVVGAVDSPGRYQYVPLKTFSYYVSLAGGIPLGATPGNISITDSNGNPVPLDSAIEPEDRIIVTEERITVAGGVYAPGSYGFVPGRTVPYYLGLAGGIDPELNSDDSLSVLDAGGNPRGVSDTVQPGDRIFVHKNDFQYGFNRYFPVITSALTLVTSMITLITILSN